MYEACQWSDGSGYRHVLHTSNSVPYRPFPEYPRYGHSALHARIQTDRLCSEPALPHVRTVYVQIMPQCNCLHQILVQLQSLCYGSGCLGYLQCMRQSGPIVVSLRCQKHLCFILQSAECLAVDNTVSVPLKYRPDITLFLRLQPSL